MNLREGRIGTRETINVIGIALLINGMFSIDSAKAYANGNSTFISLPLALRCRARRFYLYAMLYAAVKP